MLLYFVNVQEVGTGGSIFQSYLSTDLFLGISQT